jgi:hypothetical protein
MGEAGGAGCQGRLMRQAGRTGWWDRLLKDSQVMLASGTDCWGRLMRQAGGTGTEII